MEFDVRAGDGEDRTEDPSEGVAEVVELFDEGVGARGMVGEEPEGGRVVRASPADRVDGDSANGTEVSSSWGRRGRDARSCFCSSHDE